MLKAEAGGRGGIRTHGGLPHARFRVECLKPDSATLPKIDIVQCDAEERGNYQTVRPLCKSFGIVTVLD
jgi:hypothetical protein